MLPTSRYLVMAVAMLSGLQSLCEDRAHANDQIPSTPPTELTPPAGTTLPAGMTTPGTECCPLICPESCDGVADIWLQGASEADSIWQRKTLGGDWLGLRTGMAEQGFTFDLSTTQYYQGVTRGGVDEDFLYGGRNDYLLTIDGEKAGLWKGLFVSLHGETRYADSANALSGTMLPPNLALSLPKPNGTVSVLSGVKVMQFLSEEFVTFAGKINTFDDFKQPLTGAGATNGFMNTALMLNPVLVRTVPYSAFGAGFAILQDLQPVFSFSVFDTNTTPTTSGFDTFFDNGVALVAQANLPTQFFGLPGHQGVIGTYSTGSYTNLSPSVYLSPQGLVIQSPPKEGSWSLSYNFDQAFWVSASNPRQQWGIFANLGIADDNPSPVRWIANAGVSGTSPLSGRTGDTFGAGYFYTGTSGALQNFAPILLPLDDEQGVELYYNVAVTPWCHVTPDIQLLNPFRQRVDSSVMVGLRAKIDF